MQISAQVTDSDIFNNLTRIQTLTRIQIVRFWKSLPEKKEFFFRRNPVSRGSYLSSLQENRSKPNDPSFLDVVADRWSGQVGGHTALRKSALLDLLRRCETRQFPFPFSIAEVAGSNPARSTINRIPDLDRM